MSSTGESEPTRIQPAGPPPVPPPVPPPSYRPTGPGYGPPAGGPPPPRRTRGNGWLWALGGALVAALACVAVVITLLLTGTLGGGSPDLGDYAFTDELCESMDYEPLSASGFALSDGSEGSDNPTGNSNEHDAIDSMSCYATLTGEEESRTAYHYSWTELHKETDPEPEFEARYLAYEGYEQVGGETKYEVEELSDLGDQAFLVTQTDKDGKYVGGEMILGILDGGLTYQGTWNAYSSTSTTEIDGDEIADQLREVAESTLDAVED